MKFVCERCQTRYSIADDKVRQRIVKIRCKTCDEVITIRGEGEVKANPAAPPSPGRAARWYLSMDGGRKGPMSAVAAAREIVASGRDKGAFVWEEGFEAWKPAREVPAIADEIGVLRRGSPADATQKRSGSSSAARPAPPGSAARSSPAPGGGSSTGSGSKNLPGTTSGSVSKPVPRPGSAPKTLPPPRPGSGLKSVPGPTVSSGPKSVPGPAVSSGPKRVPPPLPGSGPKGAPPPLPGSGPKRAPPPLPGSGPKSAPPPLPGSGPKGVPPPLPGSGPKGAPPPLPGSGPKSAPAARSASGSPAESGSDAGTGGAGKGSASRPEPPPTPAATRPAPPPIPASPARPMPTAAQPTPASARRPEAPAEAPASTGSTEFDEEPSTKPDKHRVPEQKPRAAAPAAVDGGPAASPARAVIPSESTPLPEGRPPARAVFPSEGTPLPEDEKTPPPSKPLPPVVERPRGSPVPPAAYSPFPAAFGAGASAVAATPLPAAGAMFGAAGPAALAPQAETGLSRLTGLPGLVHRYGAYKYIVAAAVVVVLVIAIVILTWTRTPEKPTSWLPLPRRQVQPAAAAHDETSAREEAERTFRATVGAKSAPVAQVGPRRGSAGSRSTRAPQADPFEPAAPSPELEAAHKRFAASENTALVPRTPPSPAVGVREVSQAEISRVVRDKNNQAALKVCYERALKRDGRVRSGRVDVTVSIGASGAVKSVQVHAPVELSSIESCIRNAVRRWLFPKSTEDYGTSFSGILQGG